MASGLIGAIYPPFNGEKPSKLDREPDACFGSIKCSLGATGTSSALSTTTVDKVCGLVATLSTGGKRGRDGLLSFEMGGSTKTTQ